MLSNEVMQSGRGVKRQRALVLALLCASTLPLGSNVALAKPKPSASSSAAASAAPNAAPAGPSLDIADKDLPALPTLAPIKKVEAEAEAVKDLEAFLAKLTSEKKDIREAGVAELDKITKEAFSTPSATSPNKPPSNEKPNKRLVPWIPAIHGRIQEIRESLNRDRAPQLLADARKVARKSMTKQELADEDKADWLLFIMKAAAPKDEAWKDLCELLAMIRLLGAIKTTPAVREMVELRANFGEFLRLDLSRQMERLGDYAVPALIEARKHDATVVQRFADTELDKLGKVTAGEIVSMRDPDALADTLRAFGRVRDEEAVDVLLSFANHDRRNVRDAAREAVAAIGEAGRWRLRDAYQSLTGEKVDKNVPWDILAKRIFAIYDKARVSELWTTFSTGVEASKANKHAEAIESFDKVLARDPLFERRKEMAASYFEVATTIGFDKAEDRLAMLRKARRLDPTAENLGKLDAEIAYTESKILIADGRPDRLLLERATKLDPEHKDAAALLASFEQAAVPPPPAPPKPKYGLAGGIAGGTLALLGVVAFFWRRKVTTPAKSTPQAPAVSAPP